MENFDFDYHEASTQYPESGERLQLGGSYVSSVEPASPDQRIITLTFAGMFYYCHPITGVMDASRNPKLNFYRFELFYQRHKLWKSFMYRHPVYGDLVVKFNKPLKTPERDTDGPAGSLKGFSVELLEQP